MYVEPPGEPVVAERIAPLPPTQEGGHAHVLLPIGEQLTIGYVARLGGGRVVVLGISATPELLLAIHAWLGVSVACHAGIGQQVQSALFQRDGDYFVVVTSTASHPQDVVLRLDLPIPPATARDLALASRLHLRTRASPCACRRARAPSFVCAELGSEAGLGYICPPTRTAISIFMAWRRC